MVYTQITRYLNIVPQLQPPYQIPGATIKWSSSFLTLPISHLWIFMTKHQWGQSLVQIFQIWFWRGAEDRRFQHKWNLNFQKLLSQIVISNVLANFVTIFVYLAVIITFGNFKKKLENFEWHNLLTMMSKVNIRQSTADFWQSWPKFLSFARGFYSILSTFL